MKRTKVLGIGVLAALALTVAALPVSIASAAGKQTVTLTSEGKAVPNGSPADTGLLMDGCEVFAEGTLSNNGTKTATSTATKNSFVKCGSGEGASETGTLTSTAISSKGKVSLKGTISITDKNSCSYSYKSFKLTKPLEIPGVVFFEGTTVGKLGKGSAPACAKTKSATFAADMSSGPGMEPFSAE